MKRRLHLHVCNRPEWTRQCVDHLLRCRGLGRWDVRVSVDIQRGGRAHPEVLEAVSVLPGEPVVRADLGRRRNMDHHKRINAHIRRSWDEAAAAKPDLFFHLEDDIMLAPDALQWAEGAWLEHGDTFDFIGCHGPAWPPGTDPAPLRDQIQEHRCFSAFGSLIDRATLESIVAEWRDGWASWDEGITDRVKSGRARALVPVLPRSRNVGQWKYRPGGREHRAVWSGDLPEYQGDAPHAS